MAFPSVDSRDLKFFVDLVNFDELGRQRADELKAIPMRFW